MNPKDTYETVGFHRILGGFYYNLLLVLASTILFTILSLVLLPLIRPFPEVEGYSTVTYGLLSFLFGFFDLGSTKGGESHAQLNDGLLRFVGEYSTTKPYQALRYIQFFVWFQMITGIIQITLISVLALSGFFKQVNHLIYFILGYSLIQFPGCTQIFESIFKGFLRLDAYGMLTFLKNSIVKFGVQLICVVIGRYWGSQHPQFGDMMGATLGWIISLWVIELVTFAVGIILYRQKIGKRLGLSVTDIFIPDFDKKVAFQTLSFSFKLWIGNLVGYFMGLWTNIIIILYIPAYAAWVGLLALADQLAGIAIMGGIMIRNSTPALSEAFLLRKFFLFKSYLLNLTKFTFYTTTQFLYPMIILLPPLISSIVPIIPGFAQYETLSLIIPLYFTAEALVNSLISLSGRLLLCSDHPMAFVIIGIVTSPAGLLGILLFLSLGLSWQAIILSNLVGRAVLIIALMLYFHLKIQRLPFGNAGFLWQAIIAPILTGIITFLPLLGLRALLIPWLNLYPVTAMVFTLLFCLFLYPMFVYSPIYAFIGGTDSEGIIFMQKAIKLSGPSMILTKIYYQMLYWGQKACPWKNRIRLPYYEEAERERQELNALAVHSKIKNG